MFARYAANKIRLRSCNEKTTTFNVVAYLSLRQKGIFLLKRITISPFCGIVSLMSDSLKMNMLEKIQSQLEHLSKSERKVAEVILAFPDQAIHSSIAALAQQAGVSEPTVNRFCRSLDTRGFPDFKLHLAQSLANGTPMLIATSMKMTVSKPILAKFSSQRWQAWTMYASRSI
jgi:hypothetical protein